MFVFARVSRQAAGLTDESKGAGIISQMKACTESLKETGELWRERTRLARSPLEGELHVADLFQR